MAKVLSLRALNRATVARQLLLERSSLGVVDVTEHLVGLQSQTPHTWYVGYWSRMASVTPKEISAELESRALRTLVEPVLARGMQGNYGKNLVGLDREELAAAGRELLDDEPLIFSELGRRLAPRWPGRDPMSLAQGVRSYAALAQVTPRGLWGRSGKAAHAPLESWLDAPLGDGVTADDLVLRYLGAFGPASVKDAQVWSGLTRLAEVFERLRPRLMAFTDADGRELFDLRRAPRPD